ncbi:hypothetical protein DRP04_12840 [Archaeoglobales archaeon]|nr:MAG: hypothetical protein DRP04_12840 [Archaeoglobales archaeon]
MRKNVKGLSKKIQKREIIELVAVLILTSILSFAPSFIAITESKLLYLIVWISYLELALGFLTFVASLACLIVIFKRSPKRKPFSIKYIILLFFLWYSALTILTFLVSYNIGVALQYLLLAAILYFIYFFIQKKKTAKFRDMLTYVLMFLTFVQIWLTFFNNMHIIYFSSGNRCPAILKIDKNNEFTYTLSLGNYGNWPAIISYRIENISNCYPERPKGSESQVIVPVEKQGDKQTNIQFKMKFTNSSQPIEFKIRFLIYGSDIFSRFFGGLKIFLRSMGYNLESEIKCKYKVHNSTFLKLVEEGFG